MLTPLCCRKINVNIVSRERERGYRKLCVCLSGLLLVSAMLKGIYPAVSSHIVIGADVAITAEVQIELALGIALLFGLWPRFTWATTVGLFSIFAIISVHHALANYASCGCFGAIKVHPWFTFAIDIIVVTLLLAKRDSPTRLPRLSRNLRTSLIAIFAYLSIEVLVLLPAIAKSTVFMREGVTQYGTVVVLDPSKWQGHQLPIYDQISPDAVVSSGSQIMLLYHHDCPECQKALARYERLGDTLGNSKSDERIVIVEVPPFGPREPESSQVYWTRLSADREWFVQTPVEVQVSNGVVTRASYDLPSIAEIR